MVVASASASRLRMYGEIVGMGGTPLKIEWVKPVSAWCDWPGDAG